MLQIFGGAFTTYLLYQKRALHNYHFYCKLTKYQNKYLADLSWLWTTTKIWALLPKIQHIFLMHIVISWYNNSNLCINHSKNIATLCFGTFHSFLVGLDRNWVYGSCYILCPKGLWSSKADNRSQELNICNVCAHHYNPLLNNNSRIL